MALLTDELMLQALGEGKMLWRPQDEEFKKYNDCVYLFLNKNGSLVTTHHLPIGRSFLIPTIWDLYSDQWEIYNS